MTTPNPQVDAAVTFLIDYSHKLQSRREKLESLEKKLDSYKPAVDEYKRVKEAIDAIKSQNKSDEKFLMSMKKMIERNYDVEIRDGEASLFDHVKLEEQNADQ